MLARFVRIAGLGSTPGERPLPAFFAGVDAPGPELPVGHGEAVPKQDPVADIQAKRSEIVDGSAESGTQLSTKLLNKAS